MCWWTWLWLSLRTKLVTGEKKVKDATNYCKWFNSHLFLQLELNQTLPAFDVIYTDIHGLQTIRTVHSATLLHRIALDRKFVSKLKGRLHELTPELVNNTDCWVEHKREDGSTFILTQVRKKAKRPTHSKLYVAYSDLPDLLCILVFAWWEGRDCTCFASSWSFSRYSSKICQWPTRRPNPQCGLAFFPRLCTGSHQCRG